MTCCVGHLCGVLLLGAGCGLRVLRVGEPVKVRSSLQRFTLRAQIDAAVVKDATIAEARSEQKRLRQKLRSMRKERNR
jgi:hypothetical protein